MLGFERRVVTAMLTSDDPQQRARTLAYVDGALGELPELIRAGVVGETVLLGAWYRFRGLPGRLDDRALIGSLESNPIGLVRQYVRLLRSLVLFSEQEAAAAEQAAGPVMAASAQTGSHG